ncbi:glycoside hydrolase family 38 C-terminal domain-containing protein [Niabella insulamsoli]|uniref:glycoside hydrolase family 38 C-terminal domain-containing protein n=1 Tax=Niabella insulamsoli TaxID=3144874 RepID=UPI0031FC45FF
MKFYVFLFLTSALLFSNIADAQKTYFVDGYHGGVYGHYPDDFTAFIIKHLEEKKDWKVNLEIEPETWDSVMLNYPQSYKAFKNLYTQQDPDNSRIEFVNPAYGQSYFFNISGESMIRHFEYGIKKMREHFPGVKFDTYSSEEPCFTSALPMILKSFGFKYAVLKNPNTCWGGYTRAFGNEILNWVAPDGTKMPTVPRYSSEGLVTFSTWQTDAWTNSAHFFNAARKQGIKNPVGMCLQDAGWRTGPWLHNRQGNTNYTTWSQYFSKIAGKPDMDWRLSQEDIQVSLVWGSQKLQQISQWVRIAEQRLVQAEKLCTLAQIYGSYQRPSAMIDEAWRNLLLAQHHDCWIVPLHWYDRAMKWLAKANQLSDQIIEASQKSLIRDNKNHITIINTTAKERSETALTKMPYKQASQIEALTDKNGKRIPFQLGTVDKNNQVEVLFKAKVAATGIATYNIVYNQVAPGPRKQKKEYIARSSILLETDLYQLLLNKNTGAIQSLVCKKNNKELIDASAQRAFNGIGGQFYDQGKRIASTDQKNEISIVEDGPVRKKVIISGKLGLHRFNQTITLAHGEPRIDFETIIHWSRNQGIGDAHAQHEGYNSKDRYKAFYVDTSKLSVAFPVNLRNAELFKDAPFDVTKSGLTHTFFNRWDDIKNNVVYRWIDLYDSVNNSGIAFFTDHTSSYSHGARYPLSLTLAYSGKGLWDANYRLKDSSSLRYSMLPHDGDWRQADLNAQALKIGEPLLTVLGSPQRKINGILDLSATGLELTACNLKSDTLTARFYNAAANKVAQRIQLNIASRSVSWVALNGVKESDAIIRSGHIVARIPPFGVRTLQIILK